MPGSPLRGEILFRRTNLARIVLIDSSWVQFLARGIAHPRRERKPEFTKETCPPLGRADCSRSFFSFELRLDEYPKCHQNEYADDLSSHSKPVNPYKWLFCWSASTARIEECEMRPRVGRFIVVFRNRRLPDGRFLRREISGLVDGARRWIRVVINKWRNNYPVHGHALPGDQQDDGNRERLCHVGNHLHR